MFEGQGKPVQPKLPEHTSLSGPAKRLVKLFEGMSSPNRKLLITMALKLAKAISDCVAGVRVAQSPRAPERGWSVIFDCRLRSAEIRNSQRQAASQGAAEFRVSIFACGHSAIDFTNRQCLARLEGFEPPTFSFEGCRSIHLSYRRETPVYPICPAT